MPWLNPLLVIYALLNIVLGIVGAVKAHEYYSLAGVGIGLLIFGCLAIYAKRPRMSRIASLVIAALVAGRFMPKFLGGQWYPAGIEVISSVIVVAALFAGHLMAQKANRAA